MGVTSAIGASGYVVPQEAFLERLELATLGLHSKEFATSSIINTATCKQESITTYIY